jgi:mono/diheme cytochrome c family protein
MKNTKALLTASLLSLTLINAPTMAAVKTIVLPPDGVQLKPSPLPGYVKAQGNCVACHSAEYMLYQPPTAPRAYWDTMVKRMKAVFKAPLNDADIPEIVDYLAKTYGNEQPK